MKRPLVVLFDSGLGGLSVFKAVRKAREDADYLYVADNGGFPYGSLGPNDIVRRVITIFDTLQSSRPALAVIACNTASTLVLPFLRQRHAYPFVGTVPAVKPAAENTTTGIVAVLSTPGTLDRDYTRNLINEFASHVHVRVVGSANLAGYAERILSGGLVDDEDIKREVMPAFYEMDIGEMDTGRCDTIVLACTHYPLILDRLQAVAPWHADWIDPAPAIACRVVDLLREWPVMPGNGNARAIITDPDGVRRFRPIFQRFGLSLIAGKAEEVPA